MAPALSKEFLDIHANYRVWIHSETRTWHDNIQLNFYFHTSLQYLKAFKTFWGTTKMYENHKGREGKS